MRSLKTNLLELICRTSAELTDDVVQAVQRGAGTEQQGSSGSYAMNIIVKNIDLARLKSAPLCQDTGSILFFVEAPVGFDQLAFEKAACAAVAEATAKGYLRQNSVDSVTGKNTGNNLGPGSPSLHFRQHRGRRLDVRLILKGGGCENVGAQYSLPDTRLSASRDLDGVRKAILDAVLQAQGKGCSPGILGVCIGGDRATGYLHSKEQLLRLLDDANPDPALAALEQDVVASANKLGIGPMGFGGATTLLGCKIGTLNRLPASFFVSISYMCWAYRRQGFVLDDSGKVLKWIY
jgi:tartrate/fumarate subfamily iron-sulfur-dependent hydro-lyase alpha chain